MEVNQIALLDEGQPVTLQTLKMDGCAYVFLSRQPCTLQNLTLSVQTRYVSPSQEPIPSVVPLVNSSEQHEQFIRRLSKKTGLLLLCSLSLSQPEIDANPQIEAAILSQLGLA